MRAEERGADRDGTRLRELACDPKRFALGGKLESVAGFDFDRAHALSDQSVQSLERRSRKLVFACGAGRADCRKNSAAFAGDLLICGPRESQLEFMRPIASIDEMGVAIDEGGGDPAAVAIDDPRRGARGGRKLVLRANEDDSSVARGDRAGFDDPQPRAPFDQCRKTSVEPNRVGWSCIAGRDHQ